MKKTKVTSVSLDEADLKLIAKLRKRLVASSGHVSSTVLMRKALRALERELEASQA